MQEQYGTDLSKLFISVTVENSKLQSLHCLPLCLNFTVSHSALNTDHCHPLLSLEVQFLCLLIFNLFSSLKMKIPSPCFCFFFLTIVCFQNNRYEYYWCVYMLKKTNSLLFTHFFVLQFFLCPFLEVLKHKHLIVWKVLLCVSDNLLGCFCVSNMCLTKASTRTRTHCLKLKCL